MAVVVVSDFIKYQNHDYDQMKELINSVPPNFKLSIVFFGCINEQLNKLNGSAINSETRNQFLAVVPQGKACVHSTPLSDCLRQIVENIRRL